LVDADAPGRVLDHGQDIDLGAVEQVGREEVARQDRLGLRSQELQPGQSGLLSAGTDAAGLKDLPHSRCRDADAQASQLAVDPAVPPAMVREPAAGSGPGCAAGSPVGRSRRARTWQPSGGGRCHGAGARLCPEYPAPKPVPPRLRYHGEQSRKQGAVCPVEPLVAWPLRSQDGELMAQDQDLRCLPRLLTPGQPKPRRDPRNQEEHELQAHDR
jgi:hypothetical protein